MHNLDGVQNSRIMQHEGNATAALTARIRPRIKSGDIAYHLTRPEYGVEDHDKQCVAKHYLCRNDHANRSAIWKYVTKADGSLYDSAKIQKIPIRPNVRRAY
jgi:hypothetical protein